MALLDGCCLQELDDQGFEVLVEVDAGTAAIAIFWSNAFGAELMTIAVSAQITLTTAGGVVQITGTGIY